MKTKLTGLFYKVVASGGFLMACVFANVACSANAHQEALPNQVKSLRKF